MPSLFATAVAAGPSGARHADGTFIDTTGSEIGSIHLVEDAQGLVHVNVKVDGLSTGLHGIHIHAVGSCIGPTFASAGGHYNPFVRQHGLENPNGPHAGDLPNLVVDADGRGSLNAKTDRVTLTSGLATLLDGDGSAVHHPCQPRRSGHRRRQRRQRTPDRLRSHRRRRTASRLLAPRA